MATIFRSGEESQQQSSQKEKEDEQSHAQLMQELDNVNAELGIIYNSKDDDKTNQPPQNLVSDGEFKDHQQSDARRQEALINKLNDDLEKSDRALDQSIKTLSESQKFKRMYEKKLQSALIFYDYIVDKNDELAILFLKDPFIDSELIENKDKARKYWNFFSSKQVVKEVSVIAETRAKKKGADSSSSSSSDTDSDSDLDKEAIKKHGHGNKTLLRKSYQRDKNWDALLKDLDDNTVQQIQEDIQLFILQNQDDESKNCLHFSCKGANRAIFDLIVDISNKLTAQYKNRQLTDTLIKNQKIYKVEKVKDGANKGENINVLRALMRTQTTSRYIPFYYLCERDNSLDLHKENEEIEAIKRNFTYMIQKMIEQESNFPDEGEKAFEHLLTYNFIHPDTDYSCLHWLSYWNDNESIETILNRINFQCKDDQLEKNIFRVMSLTKTDESSFGAGRMTPVTIAGERDNIKSLKAFLAFFKTNYRFIIKLFDGDPSYEPIPQQLNKKDESFQDKITLKVFSKNQVKEKAFHFVELYYWATFVNDREIINLFLVGLGFSPFMNISKGQTPVHATCLIPDDDVKQQFISFELFKYFVVNSSKGLKQFHQSKYDATDKGREDIEDNRYEFMSDKDIKKFEDSRQTVDSQGNSVLHYIFDIQLEKDDLRNQFLKIAIEEQIGDIRQRNVENYLPVQIPHRQPCTNIPDDIMHYFPATVQESSEADYLIVTKRKNQKFVTEQLRQMKLMKHTRFYYIQQNMPHQPSLMDQIKNLDFSNKLVDLSLISIKIPPKMIDRVATKEKTMASLTNVESSLVVKIPFQKQNRKDYNMFDSRERLDTIESILENQIDFKLMEIQGIILDHFPLHKRGGPNKALKLYNTHKWGLLIGFLTGNFYQHMYPLNFLKSYYGEKYALQVAFLLHYQAWLIPPTIFGVITILFNSFHYIYHKEDLTDMVDNYGNAFYGLLISIWASLMIESWKNTEKIIAFEWAIEKQALKKDDERAHDFKYNWVFNDTSNTKQKQRLIPKNSEMFVSRFGQIISIILTVFVMILYVWFDNVLQTQKQEFQDDIDANPNKYTKLQKDNRFFEILVYSQINSFVYAAVLVTLNLMNGFLSKVINDRENYRWQSEYEDGLIQKLFIMGFFNFYFPMFLVAFLKFFKFNDLLGLVVTQLGLKQVAINLIEWLVPLFFTRTKLKNLEEKFPDVINKQLTQYEHLLQNSFRDKIASVSAKIEESAVLLTKKSFKAFKMDSVMPHETEKKREHSEVSTEQEKNAMNINSSLPVNTLKDESNKTQKKESKKENKRQNQLTEEELKPIALGGGIWYFEDKYKELKNSRFRYYQALRDYCRYQEKPNILMLYQEVVAQFGFVTLFGQIFPLGALFSMLANVVQIRIQIGHLAITRRWKPEIAISIGKWLTIMQFLSTLSVVTNCAMIYFTHQKLTVYFIGKSPHPDQDLQENHAHQSAHESPKWEVIEFFMLVVGVEHLIILIKQLIHFRSKVPDFIHQGLKDRQNIKIEYKRNLEKKAKKAKQKKDAAEETDDNNQVDGVGVEDLDQLQAGEEDLLVEAQNFSLQGSQTSPGKEFTAVKSKDLNNDAEWQTDR